MKHPAAVWLGALGGYRGGTVRAKTMSAARQSENGKKAAAARWGKPYIEPFPYHKVVKAADTLIELLKAAVEGKETGDLLFREKINQLADALLAWNELHDNNEVREKGCGEG